MWETEIIEISKSIELPHGDFQIITPNQPPGDPVASLAVLAAKVSSY